MGQNRTSDKKNQKRKTPTFEKVFDNRNRRVRGLWIRNSIYYAQITVPTIHGSKKTRRVRLEGKTLAQARDELQKLRFWLHQTAGTPPPRSASLKKQGSVNKSCLFVPLLLQSMARNNDEHLQEFHLRP